MRILRNCLYTLWIVLVSATVLPGQENTYLVQEKSYKTPLSFIGFSPDGTLLLAGFDDGSFQLLHPEKLEVLLEVDQAHPKAVNGIVMPPNMDFILTAGQNILKVWDRQGKHLYDWRAHGTTIWNLDLSSDGKNAVTSAMNRTFLLWDVYNGKVLKKMQGHQQLCMAVDISPDDQWIASAAKDEIRIWDLKTRELLQSLHGPPYEIYDVKFGSGKDLLALATRKNVVHIWDLAKEEEKVRLQGHQELVLEVEFCPQGPYLLSASADQSVILWDIRRGERIHQFLDQEGAVSDLVFHPDGQSFFLVSSAGELKQYRLDPELFVRRYYPDEYLKELSLEPGLEERRKGESRKAYESRLKQAEGKKRSITERYYNRYLEEIR